MSLSRNLNKVVMNDLTIDEYEDQVEFDTKQQDAEIALKNGLLDNDDEVEACLIKYLESTQLLDLATRSNAAAIEIGNRYQEVQDAIEYMSRIEPDAEKPDRWDEKRAILAVIAKEFDGSEENRAIERYRGERSFYSITYNVTEEVANYARLFTFTSSHRGVARMNIEDLIDLYENYDDNVANAVRPWFADEFKSEIDEWPEDVFKDTYEDFFEDFMAYDGFYDRLVEVFDEDKAQEVYYNGMDEYLGNKISESRKFGPKTLGSGGYSRTSGLDKAAQALSVLSVDNFQEIWDEHLAGCATAKGLSKLARNDNLPEEIKTEIMKSNIRAADSRNNGSIEEPGFSLNIGVLDDLTDLQLAKLINYSVSLDWISDVADYDYLKTRLSKMVIQGEERAQGAMSIVKDHYNEDDDEQESNQSTNNQQSSIDRKKQEAKNDLRQYVDQFDNLVDLRDNLLQQVDEASQKQACYKLLNNIGSNLRIPHNKDKCLEIVHKFDNVGIDLT